MRLEGQVNKLQQSRVEERKNKQNTREYVGRKGEKKTKQKNSGQI